MNPFLAFMKQMLSGGEVEPEGAPTPMPESTPEAYGIRDERVAKLVEFLALIQQGGDATRAGRQESNAAAADLPGLFGSSPPAPPPTANYRRGY